MLVGAAAVSTLTGCPRPMMKYGGPPAPVEQRDPNEPEAIDTPADEESPPSEAPDGDEVPASEPA